MDISAVGNEEVIEFRYYDGINDNTWAASITTAAGAESGSTGHYSQMILYTEDDTQHYSEMILYTDDDTKHYSEMILYTEDDTQHFSEVILSIMPPLSFFLFQNPY